MFYRLTQKKLGSIYIVSVLIQSVWWIAYLFLNLNADTVLWMTAAWKEAAPWIKIAVFVPAFIVLLYLYLLYKLVAIGAQLWKMDSLHYHRLRIVGRHWNAEPLVALAPGGMIGIVTFVHLTAEPNQAGLLGFLGLITFVVSLGYTALCTLHFEEAESHLQEMLDIVEFM
jgi:hypothetical protein